MTALADRLKLACEGNSSEIKNFLELFINSSVVVPEKHQSTPLNITVSYPDRPFNFLAVENAGRATIPVFSDKQQLSIWTNLPLKTREISVRSLIEILPEDWWLTLNPNDEYSKDFSFWELKKLAGSSDEIDEVVQEIVSELGIRSIELRGLSKDEIPGLTDGLDKLFESNQLIQKIYTAVEVGENIEGRKNEALLIGFQVTDIEPEKLEQFRTEIRNLLAPLLIGSMNFRILIGVGFSDLELGVFADFSPVKIRE